MIVHCMNVKPVLMTNQIRCSWRCQVIYDTKRGVIYVVLFCVNLRASVTPFV